MEGRTPRPPPPSSSHLPLGLGMVEHAARTALQLLPPRALGARGRRAARRVSVMARHACCGRRGRGGAGDVGGRHASSCVCLEREYAAKVGRSARGEERGADEGAFPARAALRRRGNDKSSSDNTHNTHTHQHALQSLDAEEEGQRHRAHGTEREAAKHAAASALSPLPSPSSRRALHPVSLPGNPAQSLFLMTSATWNRLVLDIGRTGARRTMSPIPARPSASCAWYRVVDLRVCACVRGESVCVSARAALLSERAGA